MSEGPARRVQRRGTATPSEVHRRWGVTFLGVLLLIGAVAETASPAAGRAGAPAMLIVAGVGGTPEHRERFSGWARDLCAAVMAGPAPGRVRVLVERLPEAEDAGHCAPAGRSTQEELAREIASVSASNARGAGLVLVLIGHGSGGPNPRFQLPGPDLSPERLGEMLESIEAGPVTIAHLGSAAGAFVPALSGPDRVLLTASRAHETNETRFARHFIASFSGDDADQNRDGRLSALEAFDFARLGVEREYEREGLLRTEHALLDDNGDGVGSLEPEMAAGSDGVLAARRPLLFRTAEAVAESGAASPEIQRLVAERDALAARVDALRELKDGMDEETYLTELEGLLLQIAELAERIGALRGKPE